MVSCFCQLPAAAKASSGCLTNPCSEHCHTVKPALCWNPHCTFSHYDKKQTYFRYVPLCSLLCATLLTYCNNRKQYQQPKSKGGIRENHSICFKCDRYTPLTSHSPNDRKQMWYAVWKYRWCQFLWMGKCSGGNHSGCFHRESDNEKRRGHRCLFRPINRETSVVLQTSSSSHHSWGRPWTWNGFKQIAPNC